MKETIWIWSYKNQWWTTGKYTLTLSAIAYSSWAPVRLMLWHEWDMDVGPHPFEIPSHLAIARRLAPEPKLLSMEEIMDIMEGKDAET